MHTDIHGHPVTAASDDAVRQLDRTIEAYCGLRKDTGDRLKVALSADPGLAMAHILRGNFMMLFAQSAFVPRARKAIEAAEQAIAERGATAREQAHLAGLKAWAAGDLPGALAHWEAILLDHPRDIAALKLAQYVTFYLGDSAGIRDSVARVLHAWDEAVPGYGYVLGMHAFGLEEAGQYQAAEQAGRRAVALNPADVWAAHAVAHVLEMEGRQREGIGWIGGLADQWREVNNFVYHPLWHRCLYHLELGEHDRVLELYDREVRPDSTDEMLDIANGVALLWRLEQAGVDVGARWRELAERSAGHVDDHALVFGDAHYAIALATQDGDAAERLVASARGLAADSHTQGRILAELGIELLQAVLLHRRGEHGRVVDLLLKLRPQLHRIGGSHAQRDLFQQMLIDSAIRSGRLTVARALLSERVRLRPRNAWGWRHYGQVLEALGDPRQAAEARRSADALRAA